MVNILPGSKVRVYAGDGKTLLGIGTYTGDVTVWFWRMPGGNLLSNEDAGVKPDEVQTQAIEKEGGRIMSSEDNPRIVLEDGRVVYGCQVWWSPLKTEEKED